MFRGKPNPDFVREIDGPPVYTDKEYKESFLRTKNEQGYNIYWFPNYSSKPFEYTMDGKNVDTFEWTFLDMDLKDKKYPSKEIFLEIINGFPVKPTMVVDSGNGIHVYWKISDLSRDSYIQTQLALIQLFDTDTSVYTTLQLMRYPGYKNTKDPNNPKDCKLLEEYSSGNEYSVVELLQHLPELDDVNKKKMKDHIDRLEGRVTEMNVQGLSIDELPARFEALLQQSEEAKMLFERPREFKGDRSAADLALANLLYSKNFSREEAFQALCQTEKARTRGNNRPDYARNMVEKVYSDRPKHTVDNALERMGRKDGVANLGRLVNGPLFWDCLASGWRTRQLMGIVAGAGVGKTTATLQMFRDFLIHSPGSDEILIFFSLEMTEGEIYDRWKDLVGDNPELLKRLYVVSNEDDQGEGRHIGVQELYWFCKDIRNKTGKRIMAVAIDHVDAISRHVDLSKNPTFKVEGAGLERLKGKIATINKSEIVRIAKNIAKEFDVFMIVQSQTTKEKDSGGDVPLGKNAAFGISNFEWYADYIITFWRPLKRVQDRTDLRVMGWQYAKIRKQHKNDAVSEYQKCLLKFDLDHGLFSPMDPESMERAGELIKQANVLRHKETSKKEDDYRNSPLKSLTLIYSKKEGQK